MPHEESSYPSEWVQIAEKDLNRFRQMLALDDPGASAFFLQQATEKFLKAFLLSRGWRLQKIHDLEVLLNAALAHDGSLEAFRGPCQKITGMYFAERYPFTVQSGITIDDVKASFDSVEGLLSRLRSSLCVG